jgi:hypothetical protein
MFVEHIGAIQRSLPSVAVNAQSGIQNAIARLEVIDTSGIEIIELMANDGKIDSTVGCRILSQAMMKLSGR